MLPDFFKSLLIGAMLLCVVTWFASSETSETVSIKNTAQPDIRSCQASASENSVARGPDRYFNGGPEGERPYWHPK
jgi:hypothetical protein